MTVKNGVENNKESLCMHQKHTLLHIYWHKRSRAYFKKEKKIFLCDLNHRKLIYISIDGKLAHALTENSEGKI